MIRQAISCDLCGNEKRQTNHWFVAYEQNGELRLAGWNSRNRLRPGTRHLCGQTCLHKLVDDFMAKAISQKNQPVTQAGVETNGEIAARASASACAVTPASTRSGIDAGLTSLSAYEEVESSARLITPSTSSLEGATPKPAAELLTMAARKWIDSAIPLMEQPLPTARNRRIEAWERERERELRLQDCRGDQSRRRSGSR